MAEHEFKAVKDESIQPLYLNRIMWHYAIDPAHSFSPYYKQVRWNVIMMAYVLALENYHESYDEDALHLIRGFVSAWIENMLYWDAQDAEEYAARDSFIKIWKNCPYDLMTFNNAQAHRISKLINHIIDQCISPEDRQKVGEDVAMAYAKRIDGEISDET